MTNYLEYLDNWVDDAESFVIKIFITIAFLAIVIISRKLTASFVQRVADEEIVARRFSKISRILSIAIIMIGIFYMWFNSFRGVGILLWIFIFIVGLSLRDILLDIIYYFYVIFKQPFVLEDIIEIRGHVGIVEAIDFMQVHIQELGGILDTKTPTGRIITIPNRTLMEEPLINYTRDTPFVLEDVSMLIDFDADRDKAVRLAGQYIYEFYEKMQQKYIDEDEEDTEYRIFKREMAYLDQGNKPDIWLEYSPNGILIYVRFFTPAKEMGNNKSIIELGIYDIFKANNIPMPVPEYLSIKDI